MENELKHFGIMGMKWGVRRYQNPDGTLTSEGKKRYNENYSSKQRIRDKRVYSSGAVRRINKKMNAGEGLQSARSAEADRIESRKEATRVAANIGSAVGAVAGGVIAGYAVHKTLRRHGFTELSNSVLTMAAVTGGTAVGRTLGRNAAVTMGMLSGGYSPAKYR